MLNTTPERGATARHRRTLDSDKLGAKPVIDQLTPQDCWYWLLDWRTACACPQRVGSTPLNSWFFCANWALSSPGPWQAQTERNLTRRRTRARDHEGNIALVSLAGDADALDVVKGRGMPPDGACPTNQTCASSPARSSARPTHRLPIVCQGVLTFTVQMWCADQPPSLRKPTPSTQAPPRPG